MKHGPYPGRLPMSGQIAMEHGAGGKASAQLTAQLFQRHFDDPALMAGDDGARLTLPPGDVVMSTDSFVVSPRRFPGGDIGTLAVCGTVNDLAMMGARPIALTMGFILEEGLPLAELEAIAASMAECARRAGVRLVAGDTKVVERGHGDGVFINTAGVGVVPPGRRLGAARVAEGDVVIVSGPVGDHGACVLAQRPGYDLDIDVESDCAPLNQLAAALLAAAPSTHAMRDPTRGGVAAALNEIAWTAGLGFALDEDAIPVRPAVAAACDLLGLEPLDLPCEGRLLAFVPEAEAAAALAALHAHPQGRDAAIIGRAVADARHLVVASTGFGGRRLVEWRAGEPLPRIC